MKQRLLSYLAFSHYLGIGPVNFDRLLAVFGSPEDAYNAPQSRLKDLLTREVLEKFLAFRKVFDAEKKLEECRKRGIHVITRDDSYFPPQLCSISDVPICLYAKGNIGSYSFQHEQFFAIVGTRVPTSYGVHIAYTFSKKLASLGFIIVSGLALGIDAEAHKGALSEEKRTIAFLGCGVDVIYPSANHKLYEQITNKGGLVISEFPPGHTVLPGLFIARNRLISALSQGVMVVEGAFNSGGLITAQYASEQGRDVFAPPAPITSRLSEAPNRLIKLGAKPVTCIEDILEEYNVVDKLIPKQVKSLNKEEQAIFNLLQNEPCTSDEIARFPRKSTHTVLKLLSLMEIKNILSKNKEGSFQLLC